MIPLATTKVTYIRINRADYYDPDEYEADRTPEQRVVLAKNVRAVISVNNASTVTGDSQLTVFTLVSDIPSTIPNHRDIVIDESTGHEYEVDYLVVNPAPQGLDHIKAGLKTLNGASHFTKVR